jgi:hypothetical protein
VEISVVTALTTREPRPVSELRSLPPLEESLLEYDGGERVEGEEE